MFNMQDITALFLDTCL